MITIDTREKVAIHSYFLLLFLWILSNINSRKRGITIRTIFSIEKELWRFSRLLPGIAELYMLIESKIQIAVKKRRSMLSDVSKVLSTGLWYGLTHRRRMTNMKITKNIAYKRSKGNSMYT